MNVKVGDLVYVRSRGIISHLIRFIQSGGRPTKDMPNHMACVWRVCNDGTSKIVEVVFRGKRVYDLEKYIHSSKVWVKRIPIDEATAYDIADYLLSLKVRKYDYRGIGAILCRFILRKTLGFSSWDWVVKRLESKFDFWCSEFVHKGIWEIAPTFALKDLYPTPWDMFRKIKFQELIYENDK